MFRSHSRALAAVAAASALVLSACGTTDDGGGGDGDCEATIAYLGPKTGDAAALGINILNGVKLALDEYDGDCDVSLKEFDSQGDPEKATPLAQNIIKDESIIGVAGPAFSGETDATGEAFSEAGLVTVSASATNPDLAKNEWDTFHRVLGNDATQAPAAAKLMTDTLGLTKILVVDDSSEYGEGLGKGVTDALGDAVVDTDKIQQKDKDFSALVTKARSSGADGVFFSGYYTEAGLIAKALKQGGFTGQFVSGDGTLDPGFINAGGAEGTDGAVLTCPCLIPTSGEWAEAYEKEFGQPPGTYSTEGYDAMNVLLAGIDDGATDRESLLDFVNGYDEDGLTKHIKFTEEGEVSEVTVYQYEIADGKIGEAKPIE